MAETRRVVFGDAPTSDRLPDWARNGAVTIEQMRAAGTWEEAQRRLTIQREGGYAGIDALQFLLYFFGSELTVGFKELSDRARRCNVELAAIGGRRRLPTQSSMSRLLSAVRSEDSQEFGMWLIQQAPELHEVLSHPAVLTRDAAGAGWHVFDWDPTVTTLRHRALSEDEDTPEGRRRSEALAKPGYPGRKRGDVQFSRATLQHAGSGLWLSIQTAPGNGALRDAFQSAVEQVVATCTDAELPQDRAILRADGVAGNVPFVTACDEAGVRYITRLAHYQLLQDPEVVSHLNHATWRNVPSSGSGPTRQAADLGFVVLEPARDTRRDDGGPYEPIQTRVVVSRFPCGHDGRGAGKTIDGWHYELYGTDLGAEGWPEVDVVAGFYGRCGQENRFAQEDRELGLDRIFSYHLPGQELATFVGLFVWNWRICKGLELAQPPQELPEQPPHEGVAVDDAPLLPEPLKTATERPPEPPRVDEALDGAEEATPPGGIADAPVPRGETPSTLIETLDALDWAELLKDRPGWSWDACSCSLLCPADATIPFARIEPHGMTTRARFVAAPGTCDGCPVRSGCIRSGDPRYRKDIRQPVPEGAADELRKLWAAQALGAYEVRSGAPRAHPRGSIGPRQHGRLTPRLKPLSWSPPTHREHESRLQVAGPTLLPAELRKTILCVSRLVDVHVRVEMPEDPPKPSPVLATNAARRQHRRLTWGERLRWNELPDDATVALRFDGAQGVRHLLEPGVAAR